MSRDPTLVTSEMPLWISARTRVFSTVKTSGDRYPALTGVERWEQWWCFSIIFLCGPVLTSR